MGGSLAEAYFQLNLTDMEQWLNAQTPLKAEMQKKSETEPIDEWTRVLGPDLTSNWKKLYAW